LVFSASRCISRDQPQVLIHLDEQRFSDHHPLEGGRS
jgi:hypothetical protein